MREEQPPNRMPARFPPCYEILRLAVIELADVSRNGRNPIKIETASILLDLRPGFLGIVVCLGLPVVRSSVGGDQRRDQNEWTVAARFLEHLERLQKLAFRGFDDQHYWPSPVPTPAFGQGDIVINRMDRRGFQSLRIAREARDDQSSRQGDQESKHGAIITLRRKPPDSSEVLLSDDSGPSDAPLFQSCFIVPIRHTGSLQVADPPGAAGKHYAVTRG